MPVADASGIGLADIAGIHKHQRVVGRAPEITLASKAEM
jgi:hypothetical protein